MPPGLDSLKHIVVLMMENRSFDHMLGSLQAVNPNIDGVTDQLSNLDTNGNLVRPQPLAAFQGQLDPDPDHHFPAVDLQIFGGNVNPNRVANMQGFVKELLQSATRPGAFTEDNVLLRAEPAPCADNTGA